MTVTRTDDEQHDEAFQAILLRAHQNQVKFNRAKIQYKVPTVQFLGHVFSAKGLSPDQEKIAVIRDMPVPQSHADLQRFLGMVTYASKFILLFSNHTDPLRQLLHKNVDWQWNTEQQEALNHLKALLQSAPTLKYFDTAGKAWIQTDSSSKGLGACLLQDGRPIAFRI